MGRSVLSRATDWIRHAIPGLAKDLEPAERARATVAASGEGMQRGELRLLEFLAEDVNDRARSLRTSIRRMDARDDGQRAVIERLLGEVELLDELAASVSDLVVQSKGPSNLQSLDLLDPFRRARARLARRPGGGVRVRVDSPTTSPRVLANEAALVRTIALCLEASTLGAGNRGAIVVRVDDASDRVRAAFRTESAAPFAPPSARDRIRSTLALASRLASTFGAEVGAEAEGQRLVPMLTMLPEPSI